MRTIVVESPRDCIWGGQIGDVLFSKGREESFKE